MSVDPAVEQLRDEIARARVALVSTLKDDPKRRWSARDLKAASKNGWSYGAANLALSDLVEDGELIVDGEGLRLAS